MEALGGTAQHISCKYTFRRSLRLKPVRYEHNYMNFKKGTLEPFSLNEK